MAMRVATFALSNRMVTSALTTLAKQADAQKQEATGLASTDYAGYGAKSKRLLDLQVSISRSQTYIDAATTAESRTEVMYSTVDDMIDLVTSLRSLLTSATGTTSDAASLQAQAQEYMEEFASRLNTQYDGRYVFGGSNTTEAPVDLSLLSSATASSTADTSYYQGGDEIASVRVSDFQTISYGVNADNSAFEEALRAFNMIASTSSADTDTISASLELAETAIEDLTTVQTKLSLSASAMERAVTYQTEYQDDASGLTSDLSSVDVTAVTVRLSTLEAQLSASYSAISKILGLNLVDYLG
jgi:flagellar hook-associated protein 3 FlgL